MIDFQVLWRDHPSPVATAQEAIKLCDEDEFPNIETILRIVCVYPVTTCREERSFSAMERLKTDLRTAMGQERFNSLALILIHRDIRIPTDLVIEEFKNRHPRRMEFENIFTEN